MNRDRQQTHQNIQKNEDIKPLETLKAGRYEKLDRLTFRQLSSDGQRAVRL
jgi:hypothetical protein